MRVLLDECLDRRLASLITGHDVVTVPEAGWAGKKNGELLELASTDFGAFVTVDQSIEFQQDTTKFELLLVLLRSRSNRLVDLEPLVPELLRVLAEPNSGDLVRIGLS